MTPLTPPSGVPDPTGTAQAPTSPAVKGRRCTATTAAGLPCRAYAVRGSEPPRCAPHGGGRRPVGGQAGNSNALKHGVYAASAPPSGADRTEAGASPSLAPTRDVDRGARERLDGRIADLDRRLDQLSRYIDRFSIGDGSPGTLTIQDFSRLIALQGELLSRIMRLLRDRQQLQATWEESFLQECIDEALDQASIILGVQL